jgi:hypothetical protein
MRQSQFDILWWVTTNYCFIGDITECVECIVFLLLNTFHIQHHLSIRIVIDLRGEDKGVSFLWPGRFLVSKRVSCFA